MNRVLVTGASGFLGSHVMDRLSALGVPSIGIGRNPARCGAQAERGHTVLRHDLAEPLTAEAHPALGEVGTIVHCAALAAPFGPAGAFEACNVVATRNLVAFARERRVSRFVHISTPSVYFAYRDQLDVSEDMTLPSPANHYARTKRLAEDIVLAAPEIGPILLRPRGIYGKGDRTLLPRVLKVLKARPLPVFRQGAARIDLTHVDDVVDVVVTALSAPVSAEGAAYNVSGGEVLPIRTIVESVGRRAGASVRWRRMPLWPALKIAGAMETLALLLPGRPEPAFTRYGLAMFAFAQSLDLSRARTRLGWQPRISFEEGVEKTFAASGAI